MVNKCNLCGNLKAFKHLDRFVCDRCFVRLIERRVQKGLGRVFVKGNKVLVVGDLAEYFLKKSIKDLPLKIAVKKKMPSDVSGYDKVVLGMTMDDVDAGFLADIFGKDFKVEKDSGVIRILSAITDEEAVRFAKIKDLNFSVSEKNQVIKDFLKKVSKKHLEIRYNLLKNVKEVEKILN